MRLLVNAFVTFGLVLSRLTRQSGGKRDGQFARPLGPYSRCRFQQKPTEFPVEVSEFGVVVVWA